MRNVIIRPATLEDIPEILHHRRAMFEDMGVGDDASLTRMEAASENYLRVAMPEGMFRAWLAVTENGRVAGGCAVAIASWPPHVLDLQSRRAYILNLYVYPEYRRKQIARILTQTTVDWCRADGFGSVSLHASTFGRSLYESLGFEQTNEMRLWLK